MAQQRDVAFITDKKCKECKHSRDHYNINHEGKLIMGKCDYSEHSHLLNQKACREFKQAYV